MAIKDTDFDQEGPLDEDAPLDDADTDLLDDPEEGDDEEYCDECGELVDDCVCDHDDEGDADEDDDADD